MFFHRIFFTALHHAVFAQCAILCPQPHTYIPALFRHKIKLFITPVGIYNGLSFSQQEQQNSEYELMHSLYLDLWINIHFCGVLDHMKTPVSSHWHQYRQIMTSVKYNPDVRNRRIRPSMHHSFTAIALANTADLCLAESASAEKLSYICHWLEMPALQVSADQSLRGIMPLRKAKGSRLKSRIKEKQSEK